MRKSIIAILSLVAMVACTNDVTVKTQAPAAITFEDSFVEVKTRAAVDPSITTATIDAFDVWGFMDDPKGLMFDAQRVTKGEGGWTYNPLQYWTQDHNYYFYAVAPVDNADIVVNKDLNIEGLGTIDFTNTNGSVDLLYAEKQESTYNEDVNADGHETVKLTFAHLLSKVKFTFTNGFPEGTSSLKIENIKISQAPSKGTVTLNDDTAGRTWKVTDSNATLNFGHVNGGVALLPNESAECDNERLTIPADANVRYQIDFTATLYYGENVALKSEKTVYLEDQAFVIGKNYNITATIDNTNIAEDALTPIIFDVVEVEDWELGEHNGKIDFDNDGTQVNPDEPTALETPKVTAVAKENTVTLSWEAVENAASYAITVGTEMPVVTEELTYTFTGEYETEYTFNVVAIPADEEKFAASEAGVATATTEAAPAVEPTYTTVAEFLALSGDDVIPSDATDDVIAAAPRYTLKGTITSVTQTTYGNFYLNDGTGEVLIYGLCSPEGEAKYWAASGAKVGDDIVVKTIRTEYNNAPQGKNATFVELLPGTLAFWSFDATATSFTAAGGNKEIDLAIYNATAEVVATSDNAQFTAAYADGTLTITALENTTEEVIEGTINVTCGSLSQTIAVSQAAASSGAQTAVEAELVFSEENRTSFSTSQQVFEANDIKVTNDKGASTSPVADYVAPARFYKNSKVTVTAPGNITTIVFDCNSASYATALQNSGLTGTVSVSADKVTVTLDGSSNEYVISSLTGGQVRMDGVTVTYLQ